MSMPIVKNGRFHAGTDLQCGEHVVIDVAEEVIVGNRVVLGDNTYLCGRRIEIGSDFYGYSWGHPLNEMRGSQYELSSGWLEIGRGRIDEEDAILTVGSRCTFHNNRIDLARRVTIGDDVGLSPDVCIYTHYYWQSYLEGYPCRHAPVEIGDGVIVGFRSVILPGSEIVMNCVIGAQSVVSGRLNETGVYAGNPAKLIKQISSVPEDDKEEMLVELLSEWYSSLDYRGYNVIYSKRLNYPLLVIDGCTFDVKTGTVEVMSGMRETEYTDDWRDFAFKRGLRFYTQRPFKKLGRKK